MAIGVTDPKAAFTAAAFDSSGRFLLVAEQEAPILAIPLEPREYAIRECERVLLDSERSFYEIDRIDRLMAEVEEGP